jgi:hypothetical protein
VRRYAPDIRYRRPWPACKASAMAADRRTCPGPAAAPLRTHAAISLRFRGEHHPCTWMRLRDGVHAATWMRPRDRAHTASWGTGVRQRSGARCPGCGSVGHRPARGRSLPTAGDGPDRPASTRHEKGRPGPPFPWLSVLGTAVSRDGSRNAGADARQPAGHSRNAARNATAGSHASRHGRRCAPDGWRRPAPR